MSGSVVLKKGSIIGEGEAGALRRAVRVIDSGGETVRVETLGGATYFVPKAEIDKITGIKVEDRTTIETK